MTCPLTPLAQTVNDQIAALKRQQTAIDNTTKFVEQLQRLDICVHCSAQDGLILITVQLHATAGRTEVTGDA